MLIVCRRAGRTQLFGFVATSPPCKGRDVILVAYPRIKFCPPYRVLQFFEVMDMDPVVVGLALYRVTEI